jgi:Tetracyclin repressor-like, C-terminal domain
MTFDLVSKVGLHIVTIDKQDSLELDLLEHVRRPALLRRPLTRRILPDPYADTSCQTGLAKNCPQKTEQAALEHAGARIESAICTGELRKDVDRSIALDVVV